MQKSRRGALAVLALTAALGLTGCSSLSGAPTRVLGYALGNGLSGMYGPMEDNGRIVPGIKPSVLQERNIRKQVAWNGREKAGTIVVDPENHYLFLVQEGGTAMRYGIGVGKEGFSFAGTTTIKRKADWPGWTPTNNMIKRDPERYGKFAGGVPGGLNNPLGARALYLYRGGRDTHYRIHGTNEPHTIGRSMSSGCIRMMNQDVIDLERRVSVGTTVIVRRGAYEDGAVIV
ncbi:L,D-transpeptidase [Fulvimarina sp. 2208YS6-2-32]|uniref:L,D-transpeptidase n=1 Tax=Fulvimarina uroteuthidis TaxID=3098149 RepID=A0ABU5I5A9_9HYPH|nr:L,D-transpeptidase [Fulvimarina sp. 2208YS6-2-32]MDY8110567.1 L,D-transpeptidase [Fulvimarina sp. 2208YS6-2-32]